MQTNRPTSVGGPLLPRSVYDQPCMQCLHRADIRAVTAKVLACMGPTFQMHVRAEGTAMTRVLDELSVTRVNSVFSTQSIMIAIQW